jgi:hypothetical protein
MHILRNNSGGNASGPMVECWTEQSIYSGCWSTDSWWSDWGEEWVDGWKSPSSSLSGTADEGQSTGSAPYLGDWWR